MKKHIRTALLASAALALSAGAASAQAWMGIDDRQAQLDARIDAGVRSGDLSRSEAMRLRDEFRDLAILEERYRANGLSAWERDDLDRRFDQLAMQVRMERRDGDRRDYAWDDDRRDRAWEDDRRDYARDGRRGDDWGRWFGGNNWTDNRGQWVSLDRRKAQLERRIQRGLQNGQLTTTEAARLRANFNQLLRVEARYRRNGFTVAERADLDRRFDTLAAMIRFERRDRDREYGYYRR